MTATAGIESGTWTNELPGKGSIGAQGLPAGVAPVGVVPVGAVPAGGRAAGAGAAAGAESFQARWQAMLAALGAGEARQAGADQGHQSQAIAGSSGGLAASGPGQPGFQDAGESSQADLETTGTAANPRLHSLSVPPFETSAVAGQSPLGSGGQLPGKQKTGTSAQPRALAGGMGKIPAGQAAGFRGGPLPERAVRDRLERSGREAGVESLASSDPCVANAPTAAATPAVVPVALQPAMPPVQGAANTGQETAAGESLSGSGPLGGTGSGGARAAAASRRTEEISGGSQSSVAHKGTAADQTPGGREARPDAAISPAGSLEGEGAAGSTDAPLLETGKSPENRIEQPQAPVEANAGGREGGLPVDASRSNCGASAADRAWAGQAASEKPLSASAAVRTAGPREAATALPGGAARSARGTSLPRTGPSAFPGTEAPPAGRDASGGMAAEAARINAAPGESGSALVRAPGGSTVTAARETFAAMDAEGAPSQPAWIHAGAHHAEAGFEDPALGWVGVRAEVSGGGIHAALMPGSADAAQALGGHLAGLNAFLTDQHSSVAPVTVSAPENGWSQGGTGGQEAGHAMQSETGQQGPGQQPGQEAGRNATGEVRVGSAAVAGVGQGGASQGGTGPGLAQVGLILAGAHISVMA